jgi:SAM-dependent methyltransferase
MANPQKDNKNNKSKKQMSAPSADIFDTPSEISWTEYSDLLQSIRTEFSFEECCAEFLDASRYDDVDVVRGLLQVHGESILSHCDGHRNTAMHMAAANGHVRVVELLLSAESLWISSSSSEKESSPSEQLLIQRTNASGNTPLHWAAANGKNQVCDLLLRAYPNDDIVDVLQKNSAGRSILTEGFASQDEETIRLLLEHDSASEEKLISTANPPRHEKEIDNTDEYKNSIESVTHQFQFGTFAIQLRELAMAKHSEDSIIGQSRPEDDTTGYGIWPSSLVMSQWMADTPFDENNSIVLELGSGCGGPSIVAAQTAKYVYATDFNPTAVQNLQHNIRLNNISNAKAMVMNWQDPNTYPSDDDHRVNVIIGSDLIYQSDMVPMLLNVLQTLRPQCFLYAAPVTGRQGHDAFVSAIAGIMDIVSERDAPHEYIANPLQSQDDEECFLHFNELQSTQFKLYDFRWK